MYQKLFNLKKSFIFRKHAIADAKYEATRAVFCMTSRIQRHSDAALHRNCRISFFILLYSLLYHVVLSPVVHAPSGNPNKLPPDARLVAWAGTIATPVKMEPPTTHLPWNVTGVMSPNPTVVKVVKPLPDEYAQ